MECLDFNRKNVENWISSLGYKFPPGGQAEPMLEKLCKPQFKHLMRHLTSHVLPKERAEFIRKQVLHFSLKSKTADRPINGNLRSLLDLEHHTRAEDLLARNRNLQESLKAAMNDVKHANEHYGALSGELAAINKRIEGYLEGLFILGAMEKESVADKEKLESATHDMATIRRVTSVECADQVAIQEAVQECVNAAEDYEAERRKGAGKSDMLWERVVRVAMSVPLPSLLMHLVTCLSTTAASLQPLLETSRDDGPGMMFAVEELHLLTYAERVNAKSRLTKCNTQLETTIQEVADLIAQSLYCEEDEMNEAKEVAETWVKAKVAEIKAEAWDEAYSKELAVLTSAPPHSNITQLVQRLTKLDTEFKERLARVQEYMGVNGAALKEALVQARSGGNPYDTGCLPDQKVLAEVKTFLPSLAHALVECVEQSCSEVAKPLSNSSAVHKQVEEVVLKMKTLENLKLSLAEAKKPLEYPEMDISVEELKLKEEENKRRVLQEIESLRCKLDELHLTVKKTQGTVKFWKNQEINSRLTGLNIEGSDFAVWRERLKRALCSLSSAKAIRDRLAF